MGEGKSNMLVVVRVRPLNEKETFVSKFETAHVAGHNEIILTDP